jgi:hypothetical protein
MGPFGGGGFFNQMGQQMGQMGPRGQYGPWPTCGCSSILVVLAGILLVIAGCMGMIPGGYR